MHKKFLQWIILSTLCFVGMMGCTPSLQMVRATPDLQLKSNKTVTVVAIDQRSYILNKDSEPSYIGTVRGAVGTGVSYHTSSNKPVAEEVAQIVTSALMKNGFKTKAINVQPSIDLTDAKSKIKENSSDRLILIRIEELRSDSWSLVGPLNDKVYAKLHLNVFDANNKELVNNTVKFEGSVGYSMSPSSTETNVLSKIKLLLEELMNKDDVKLAFREE